MTTSSPMRKRLIRGAAAGVAVLSVALTAACGGSDSGTAADGSKLTTITLATPFPDGTPGAIPNWLGEKLGYFKDEGLNVKVVSLAGQPAQAVGLVSAGKADLVNSVPDTIIVPSAKGQDLGLKWVFTPYQAPSTSIVVAEDSPIQSAKDLAGKKVSMSALGAPFETFARANVKADGADGDSIKPVAMPVAAAMAQLQNGAVDAIVANNSEIAVSAPAAGVKVRTLPLPTSVAQTFAAGFLVRDDASKAQMDAYGKYLKAYMEAAVFAQTNPEAAVRMNWEKYPASKPKNVSEDAALAQGKAALLATVSQFKKGTNGQWGYLAPERWDADIAYLGLTGKIADPSKLYDNSLLAAANDFDEAAVVKQAQEWKN
ncbi:ABC transporter substrate-binding protein [Nocardioides sp. Kera G14]|uniref:ABC transporter substrate-binding protein n=1 Tax=Nocardioides sp. Kera G14 TaxID=2884264 RepID=UPI001D102DA8|nr:ABC transporter substrate-binding protein [Nocardioides sp. Kera G14]UDY23483.1 ABC transporter substrate-binding protein [Nocardioides sp. Kera G14]